jgi:hypothetical protein
MLNERGNMTRIRPGTIIVLALLFFGSLIYLNNSGIKTQVKDNPVTTSFFIIGNNAVADSFIKLQVFHKTWILNKDNFNLLAFNRNLLSEDKKTGIKVSLSENLQLNPPGISQYNARYHLNPSGTDEFPFLS